MSCWSEFWSLRRGDSFAFGEWFQLELMLAYKTTAGSVKYSSLVTVCCTCYRTLQWSATTVVLTSTNPKCLHFPFLSLVWLPYHNHSNHSLPFSTLHLLHLSSISIHPLIRSSHPSSFNSSSVNPIALVMLPNCRVLLMQIYSKFTTVVRSMIGSWIDLQHGHLNGHPQVAPVGMDKLKDYVWSHQTLLSSHKTNRQQTFPYPP